MAQYKYGNYLNQSQNEAYDTLHSPGDTCANSGIYRCESCGDEIASNKGNPFPPQNHHQHAPGSGPIRWKLIVWAQQKVGLAYSLGITKYSIVTNSNDSVTLRLMTEHDLAMLYEWLNRSHIVEWWGGEEARPTLADVQEQYLPSVLAQESVTPYIAMLNGEPIGYAQSYVALGSGDGWWEEETDPGVRGIDQLLANASQLGKGLGTKLVRALVELLFNDPEVTKIQTDPSPSNLRAIRCYEKAGFERQGTVTTPDGPAVYMVQTRQAFERTRSDA
nr:aminoglycoside 6-N-acetyltransferase [Klebsiella pneumoniae]